MAKLTLHEAIAVVLLGKINRTATTEEIAFEINRRGLYFQRNGSVLPFDQVRLRVKLGKGRYLHLFEWMEPNLVILKNLNVKILYEKIEQ